MVTIVPHTTRATGTVLTATIYNADHQNHVTNATSINTDAAYVNVANTFTSDQTMPDVVLTGGEIRRDVGTSLITIYGGTGAGAPGANIDLHGATHATLANDAFFDADAVTFRNAAGTGNTAVTVNGDLTVTGTLTGSAQAFDAGTRMVFQQTAAPTGWTKETTHNNKALRLTTGTVSTGGSTGFTSVFTSRTPTGTIGNTTATGTVGGTALTIAQLPSHDHGASGLTFTGDALPSHSHVQNATTGSAGSTDAPNRITVGNSLQNTSSTDSASAGTPSGTIGGTTASTGSGSTHTHSFTGTAHNHTFTGSALDFAVQYVDFIIAVKD